MKVKNIKPTNFDDIKILGLDQEENVPQIQNLSLHVLSANLIADFEPASQSPVSNPLSSSSSDVSRAETPMKIKSLRILGEIQNNGKQVIGDGTPIITFYDAGNQKIVDKVANFSDGYNFPELKPGEKYFYDVSLKDLPVGFQNLSIVFNPSSKSINNSLPISEILKIESRDIEENVATASSGGQNYYYYRLKGKMVNTGGKSVKNAVAIAYAKDKDDRVFAWNKQAFPSDLFSKSEMADINILITPLKNDRAENFEVYFFGEEL